MGVMNRLNMLSEELKEYPPSLTKKQVAEILAISERKVDDLLEKKKIPSFPVDKDSDRKQLRVNKSDLILYMTRDEE